MEKSFYEWVVLYHSKVMPELYDNGVIGDIITDIINDPGFPKTGNLRTCIKYLSKRMPTSDGEKALKIMTQFYSWAVTDLAD